MVDIVSGNKEMNKHKINPGFLSRTQEP